MECLKIYTGTCTCEPSFRSVYAVELILQDSQKYFGASEMGHAIQTTNLTFNMKNVGYCRPNSCLVL